MVAMRNQPSACFITLTWHERGKDLNYWHVHSKCPVVIVPFNLEVVALLRKWKPMRRSWQGKSLVGRQDLVKRTQRPPAPLIWVKIGVWPSSHQSASDDLYTSVEGLGIPLYCDEVVGVAFLSSLRKAAATAGPTRHDQLR